MGDTTIKRMKEYIAENFEDIEEQLKERKEAEEYACTASAEEFDSDLRDNPVSVQQYIESFSILFIKSGYHIIRIGEDDDAMEYYVEISLNPDEISSGITLNIKTYKGDDLSTPIGDIKIGDKIAFIINGRTAKVSAGGNFEATCEDLYVCDSPNDVFVYTTLSFEDDFFYPGKQSLSQISKSTIRTGKLIDFKIYKEYKESRVENKNLNEEPSGCYIATCVYGTYDCPALWTLRRFRDDILAPFFIGRLFIKVYYSISPHLVKWCGEKVWFQRFWKSKLDCFVNWLNINGIKNTIYDDKH